ncbi:unnamed protein product [Dovyalis caffra]|uniref:Uncharacterized protein n=1 Tax=Dovyalis caffra TaxID=77055 RepID=A0AAV1QR93_9ROSI|nr:unnamed protein product [Dovyalis caffra]
MASPLGAWEPEKLVQPGSEIISNQKWVIRYNGWLDAIHRIWMVEGFKGFFRGSVPRITWYIPASALTFMAVEFLRDQFNEKLDNGTMQEVASLSIEKRGSSLREVT